MLEIEKECIKQIARHGSTKVVEIDNGDMYTYLGTLRIKPDTKKAKEIMVDISFTIDGNELYCSLRNVGNGQMHTTSQTLEPIKAKHQTAFFFWLMANMMVKECTANILVKKNDVPEQSSEEHQ